MGAPYLPLAPHMINATGVDESSSFLVAHAFAIVMATIAALSIGGSLLARRWLRESA